MAKVLVTGHLSGIGKYIYNACIASGHTVEGVDILDSTPWNVSVPEDRDWLVEQYSNYDVLVNNAYELNVYERTCGQNELLKLFLDAWAGTNKYIMSIGSTAGLKTPQRDLRLKKYSLDKQRHTKIIKAWKKTKPNGPNVCNFNMGFYVKPADEARTHLLGDSITSDYITQLDRADMSDFGDYVINILEDRESIWVDEIYVDLPDQDENRAKFIKDFGIE
jgi:hypothetical protein|tara:strand:+ start:301 stop:960 length:660 start_codon:yes stop_codon:yes gene_type:complete